MFVANNSFDHLGTQAEEILGMKPKTLLKKVYQTVRDQRELFSQCQAAIFAALQTEGIRVLDERQLDPVQREAALAWFRSEVRPHLFPIMVDKPANIPSLEDGFPYFAIEIEREAGLPLAAVMKIPTDLLPRFWELPSSPGRHDIIYLDDVIRLGLGEVFQLFGPRKIKAWSLKLTKDSELDVTDDISESYMESVSRSLKRRKLGVPVRLVYDQELPERLLTWFVRHFGFTDRLGLFPDSRYRNYRDFLSFPSLGRKDLLFKALPPQPHPQLTGQRSTLAVVQKRDVLLAFPYHTFDHFITLLREASIHPAVEEIRITLYRVARNSSVVNALINAVRNGKKVVCVVELQARFDEEAERVNDSETVLLRI